VRTSDIGDRRNQMADELKEGGPADLDELRRLRAALAHEVANGLAAARSTSASLVEILERPHASISTGDWAAAGLFARQLDLELETQLYYALTVLSRFSPKTAQGLLRPEIVPIDLDSYMEEFVRPYRERASRRGVSIVLESEGQAGLDLPSVSVEVHMFRRALHNVFSNALKYSYRSLTSERFIRIRIQRHDQFGNSVAIRVQNYGVGILEGEIEKVFDPGFRGSEALREGVFGIGLGLADAQACIRAHGGDVKISSSEVHHNTYLTTVTIILPRHTRIERFLRESRDAALREGS
jgi:two-component system, OmpR family, sensor histidine kinase MtrB